MYARNNRSGSRVGGIVPPDYNGTAVRRETDPERNRSPLPSPTQNPPKVSIPSPTPFASGENYVRRPQEIKTEPRSGYGADWRSPFGTVPDGVSTGTASVPENRPDRMASPNDRTTHPIEISSAQPDENPPLSVFSGIGSEELLLGTILLLLLTGEGENRDALLLIAILFIAGL